jgi:hypothetical protein
MQRKPLEAVSPAGRCASAALGPAKSKSERWSGVSRTGSVLEPEELLRRQFRAWEQTF